MRGYSDLTKMADACGLEYKGLIMGIVEMP